MKIADIISFNNIYLDINTTSKKALFKEISSKVSSRSNVSQSDVLDNLNNREKLGSTAIGDGVAIPHTKIVGIKKIFSLFLRLKEPIDFSAPDSKKVDLIFVIVAPQESRTGHLLALAEISKFLRNKNNMTKLRNSKKAETIFKLFSVINVD